MQVRYGSLVLPAGEAQWQTFTRTRSNDAGVPVEQTSEVTVTARLTGTSQLDIAAQSGFVRRVLSGWGNDLVLYLDSGGVAESLPNATSLGGTRVVEGPNFFDGRGADYSLYRFFTFKVAASYPAAGFQNLIEYEERLMLVGGGAEYAFLQPKRGPAVKVQVAESTPYTATQTGSATGLLRYPRPPQPLWPAAEFPSRRQITESRPIITTGVLRNYRIEWTYMFGSETPLA